MGLAMQTDARVQGQPVRIFVASPGDLSEERDRVRLVINSINQRYRDVACLDYYRWEDDSFKAHTSYQPQILDTSQFDLVIGLFWSRIGVPDPRLHAMPAVLTSSAAEPDDGFRVDEPFPSGTAYEVLTALETHQRTGKPDVYVIRRLDVPMVSVSDRTAQEEAHRQWLGVTTFFERWFERRDGTKLRAYESYAATERQSGPDSFESLLRKILYSWMEEKGFSPIVWPIEVLGSPFRALKTFDYQHQSIFLGRDWTARRAFDLLRERAGGLEHSAPRQDHPGNHQAVADRQALPFLLISGVSGAGKSSFMRAGIAPLCVPPGEPHWRIALVRTPGASNGGPALALARALFEESGVGEDAGGVGPALPELVDIGCQDAAALAALCPEAQPERLRTIAYQIVAALDLVGRKESPNASRSGVGQSRLLLLVDQLEELFSPRISNQWCEFDK